MFDKQDVVHSYHPPGSGDNTATHQHRLPKVPSTEHRAAEGAYPPVRSRTQETSSTAEDESKTPVASGFMHPPSQSTDDLEERAAAPSNTRFIRPDARDVFQSSPSTTALMSSSSTPESNAGDGQGNSEEDYREPREQHRGNPLRSPRFGKGYPKGEDDQEESVRLWQRQSLDSSEDGAPENSGGVRLVSTGSSNRLS